MKNIIFAALLLFGCISAFAQEKTITQTELETLLINSSEKLKGKSYRMTIITKSSVEGRPQTDFSSKTIMEIVSPTIRRTLYESTFQSGTKKSESIRIGDKVYTRQGEENWQEKAYESDTQKISKAPVAENQLETQTECKYIGIEKLNNQDTRLYTKIVKSKSINQTTGKETSSINTTKYWFGEDGSLLKEEMEMDSNSGAMIFHTRLTQVREIDPNINIEAPKIIPPSK